MVLAFGDCRLDTDRRELLQGGEPVPLAPQVFDLIWFLIRHRDRVVTRSDLLAAVWSGRSVSESALTTRINAARKVLGDSGEAQALIRTIPRKGFRFVGAVVEQSPKDSPVPDAPSSVPERRSRRSSDRAGAGALLPLPEKPSIAVLAFANMSGDPEQEYFADGIAEDIITALAQWHGLFVIARTSSFIYKGRSVGAQQVGRELGVHYVLEGSIRTAGNRVRVTAQLIDAISNAHVWAERYDRDLADLFAVQDEITQCVAAAIAPAIRHSEGERAARRPPDSLSAWEAYHRAMWHRVKYTPEEFALATACFVRAVELDPRFATAYADWAMLLLSESRAFIWDRSVRDEKEAQARDLVHRAIALDPADAMAHAALARVLLLSGRHEESLAEAAVAVSLAPNSAMALGCLGVTQLYSGRHQEALETFQMTIRLSPLDSQNARWRGLIARAHYRMEDYPQAIALAQAVCRAFPNRIPPHLTLIAALGQTGQVEAAQIVVQQARRTIGDFFLQPGSRSYAPEQLRDHAAHVEAGLQKAGFIR